MTFSTTARARLQGACAMALFTGAAFSVHVFSVDSAQARANAAKRQADQVAARAAPAIIPPEVRLVWAPPHISADGKLHISETTYTLTPGKRVDVAPKRTDES